MRCASPPTPQSAGSSAAPGPEPPSPQERQPAVESDKRYFIEGLFIIFFTAAAAAFAVWLGSPGQRDDMIYRIRFADSVTGLAVGDPVKFRGVDVGNVKAMALDPADPRQVIVDVRLRRETPVKEDTRASL